MKERTNTAQQSFLAPAMHHDCAMVTKVEKKTIPGGFIIYEWSFEVLVNDEARTIRIGMFASQMGDLLRALGQKEVAKDDFEWDLDEVVGMMVSFDVVHNTDKKGTVRAGLANIKKAEGTINPGRVKTPEEIEMDWETDAKK